MGIKESQVDQPAAAEVTTGEGTVETRLHLEHFLMAHPEVDEIVKAGFLVYVGGKLWMYTREWEEKLEEYLGRK